MRYTGQGGRYSVDLYGRPRAAKERGGDDPI